MCVVMYYINKKCDDENYQLHTYTYFTQLYYFNSVLSLYFPYDFCLFKEMDAVLSYGLRYIPIVITSSVCIILFIVYK